jgi:hypothetical protein
MDQVMGEQKPEKRDVSKQTLVVLVILAVVVSLLGTFTVLRETSGVSGTKVVYNNAAPSSSAQGMVSINIVNPNAPPAATPKVGSAATGYVALKIVPVGS